MKVYVVGMSNTWALKHALPSFEGKLDVDVEFLLLKNPDPWRHGPAKLRPEFFGEKLDAPLVVSLLFGGWHTSLGLIEHPVPFDFEMPGYPPPVPDATRQIIPYRQLFEMFDRVLRQQFQTMTSLRALVRGRLVHLEPQPPIGSDEHLRRYPGPFAEAMKGGITPKHIRVKIWALQSVIIKAICEELEVEFLPFPQEAIGPDGCLREDLCAKDAGHANRTYGLMALERIDAIARALQRSMEVQA